MFLAAGGHPILFSEHPGPDCSVMPTAPGTSEHAPRPPPVSSPISETEVSSGDTQAVPVGCGLAPVVESTANRRRHDADSGRHGCPSVMGDRALSVIPEVLNKEKGWGAERLARLHPAFRLRSGRGQQWGGEAGPWPPRRPVSSRTSVHSSTSHLFHLRAHKRWHSH